MPWPNFLIIGAGKSGTTSLYSYLRQHPQIFMPSLKEPQFFCFVNHTMDFQGPGDEGPNRTTTTKMEDYLALFEDAGDAKAIGEASVIYITYPGSDTAERIKTYVPETKLIAILRHPVDRAYSNFIHATAQGYETSRDLLEAFSKEEDRIKANWSYFWRYRHCSYYAENLRNYYQRFQKDQIKIYLYEEWRRDNQRVLKDIFRFLEVDQDFQPDFSHEYHTFLIPKSLRIKRMLEHSGPLKSSLKAVLPAALQKRGAAAVNKLNSKAPPPLEKSVRRQLTEEFREDILSLQELIGRNLSHWLDCQ